MRFHQYEDVLLLDYCATAPSSAVDNEFLVSFTLGSVGACPTTKQ